MKKERYIWFRELRAQVNQKVPMRSANLFYNRALFYYSYHALSFFKQKPFDQVSQATSPIDLDIWF